MSSLASLVTASPPPPNWYTVREEDRLHAPDFPGDEPTVLESKHPSQKFANTLSQLRSTFPGEVWHAITSLFPDRYRTSPRPCCVDIAVGAEGRAGVELARRGFRVIGVEAVPTLLARTFAFAQSQNAHIQLMTAKVEHSQLADSSADLVSVMHGLHLVDTAAALREAWRLLRPGGKLVAAWNDRNLSTEFACELEDILERHVASYNRFQKQRGLETWGEVLQEGGMFKLDSYSVHPNPIPIHNAAALLDVLDCMSFVRSALRGEARKRFNNDVREMLVRRFGGRPFALPLESKVYILHKIHEGPHGGHKGGHHHHSGRRQLHLYAIA